MGGKTSRSFYTPAETQPENFSKDLECGNGGVFIEETLENIGYKGVDNNMCSVYGRQNFELEKIYECKEKIELCKHGFHLCKKLENVFKFSGYSGVGNRYFIVKYGREFLYETGPDKICSKKIQLVREIDYKLITDADKNTQYITDCFLVYIRQENYNIKILQYFIDQGMDITIHENHTIRTACLKGDLDLVKYLVDKGADIKARNNEPMNNACKYGHLHVAEYLSSQGVLFKTNDILQLDDVLKNGFITKIQYKKFMKEVVYNTKLW